MAGTNFQRMRHPVTTSNFRKAAISAVGLAVATLWLPSVVAAQDQLPDIQLDQGQEELPPIQPDGGQELPPDQPQEGQPPQDLPPDQGGQAADGVPLDEIQPEPEKKDTVVKNPVAEFAGLDKITGRITSFDVYINETVQFGALQVTPKICYSRPDAEEPKTDSFVEVDEITLDRKIRRIFTGWMFAESPGLSAVEHPVYDVWLKSCKQKSDVPPPETAKSN